MKYLSLALVLAAFVPSLATADPVLLAFEGGIGVDPVAGVTSTGSPALNVVRGVSPGGFTWQISRLSAQVQVDGRITVDGRGLLLTAGNVIGTNGGQRVFATLFCGPAAAATAHSSSMAGVAIEANGDFRIDDALTPAPPTSCDSPLLLIVSAANGHWFAAGIPKNDAADR
jgi:hypothetical protein